MLQLAQIKDWLKTLELEFEHYYIGKLPTKRDKSLGIYQLKNVANAQISLGGLVNTKHQVKGISLLIHWNNNHNDTEKSAYDLYQKLLTLGNFQIEDIRVYFIELLANEPIDVSTDEKGVYERVIELNIHYERRL